MSKYGYGGDKLTPEEFAKYTRTYSIDKFYKNVSDSCESIKLDKDQEKELAEELQHELKFVKKQIKSEPWTGMVALFIFMVIASLFMIIGGALVSAGQFIIGFFVSAMLIGGFVWSFRKESINAKFLKVELTGIQNAIDAFEKGNYTAYSDKIKRKAHYVFGVNQEFFIECENVCLSDNGLYYRRIEKKIIIVFFFDEQNELIDYKYLA